MSMIQPKDYFCTIIHSETIVIKSCSHFYNNQLLCHRFPETSVASVETTTTEGGDGVS